MKTDNGSSQGHIPTKMDPRGGQRAALVAPPLPGRAGPVPGRPAPPASGLNGWAVLHGIRRWWKIALPVGVVLSAIGGLAGWMLIVPPYSAAAYVQLSSANERLVFETADMTGGGVNGFKMFKNTQQQIMLTPFVLNAALRDDEVSSLPEINQPNSIAWLQESIKVTFPSDGEVMRVSLEAPSATSCVKIVNAVVDAYMDEVVDNDRDERRKRLDDLEVAREKAETKVRTKRNELKGLANFARTGDSDSLTVAQQSALAQYGFMQEKLSIVQFELLKAEGEYRIAQEVLQKEAAEQASNQDANAEALANNEPTEVPRKEFDLSMVARPALVVRLEDEITAMKAKMTANSSSLGNGHPSVRKMAVELKLKQEQFDRYMVEFERFARARHESEAPEARASGQAGRSSYGSATPPRFDIIEIASKIEALKYQDKILSEKVEQLSNNTRELGQTSIEVELMRSEIAGLEEVLRQVNDEIQRTSIELQTSSRVKLLSRAEAAIPPDPKKRIALTAFLALAGLVLPIGMTLAWDLSRSKVSDASAVNSVLSLPTLGTIPIVLSDPLNTVVKEKMGRREVRERINLKESVDAVAAMLLHRAHEEDRQVFMVTSAVAGEGKSTTICQLAISVARAGKKVLLVDMDLRRPSVHRHMKIRRFPGVAELLHAEEELSEVVQPSGTRNLDVIAAGRRECQVQEREMAGALQQMIAEMRQHYDLILIDACPVLPIVDARIVGKYSDGVILTLLRDVSRLPLATQACQMLKSYGVSVLGAVVIGTGANGYSAYYYSEDRQPGDAFVHPSDAPRISAKQRQKK